MSLVTTRPFCSQTCADEEYDVLFALSANESEAVAVVTSPVACLKISIAFVSKLKLMLYLPASLTLMLPFASETRSVPTVTFAKPQS